MKILGTADRGILYIREWERWLNADLIDIDTVTKTPHTAEKYDLIMVWFIDKHHVDTYIPTLRKQAPKAKICILIDDDWKQTTYGGDIWEKELEGLKFVDVIFNCNYMTHKYLKERGYNSAYEIIMTPYTADMNVVPPILLSYEERKKQNKGIAVFHGSGYNDPTNIIKIIKDVGLKPLWIGNRWSTYQKIDGLEKDEYVEWMDKSTDYLNFLNKGFIGYIDNYGGVGRFAHECAILKIPVVGTRTAFLLKEYAPNELLCDNGKIDTLYDVIIKLKEDESYYNEITTKMHEKALKYFDEEVAKRRLIENLNKYLNISL